MRLVNGLRFAVAAVSAIGLMVLAAGPHLLWILYVVPIFSRSESRHRDRLFAWQTFWTKSLQNVFARLMGLRIEYDVPKSATADPAIIIANHRSWLDIFLVGGGLYRVGLFRLTAIVKREIRKVPVLGRFSEAIQCAMISRRDREGDLQKIRQCARDSRNADASVIIFPEGTRYRKESDRRRGYDQVLKPKVGGLHTLLRELPDYRLLAVTVHWPPQVRVRTITDGATLVGQTLRISVTEIKGAHDIENTDDLLRNVWQVMDADITT